MIVTPKGETVLDMKQNMVGWLEFKADLPAGTKIFMQFGEILQDDCFYRENLRSAKCEFTYFPAESRSWCANIIPFTASAM